MNLEMAGVKEAIAAQANKISISGVQQKVLVDLTADRRFLEPVETGGAYILKPQVAYRFLPENEHLTMCLASLVGLEVPPVGLVSMKDGAVAYLVRRFDRTDDIPPRKVRQEDFCSLLGKDPTAKYDATAEDCAEVVRRYAADPAESLRRLYRLFVFSFWTSNGDMHLKNLSLREAATGGYELSPVYDLLSTRLYPHQLSQGDEALPLNGKKRQLNRSDFLAFGARCGLEPREPAHIVDSLLERQGEAAAMIERSTLPRDLRALYLKWMNKKRSDLTR